MRSGSLGDLCNKFPRPKQLTAFEESRIFLLSITSSDFPNLLPESPRGSLSSAQTQPRSVGSACRPRAPGSAPHPTAMSSSITCLAPADVTDICCMKRRPRGVSNTAEPGAPSPSNPAVTGQARWLSPHGPFYLVFSPSQIPGSVRHPGCMPNTPWVPPALRFVSRPGGRFAWQWLEQQILNNNKRSGFWRLKRWFPGFSALHLLTDMHRTGCQFCLIEMIMSILMCTIQCF